MKKILFLLFMLVMPFVSNAASPIVGFYQTIDDKTNTAKSIVALYEYGNGNDAILAGRIVALYDADGKIIETIASPVRIAERVAGRPTIVGLDIIWDMAWDADAARYRGGKIMDPQSGRVYSSEIWAEKSGTLNVRGKIGPIGRTQHWNKIDIANIQELQSADTSTWTPNIRKK